MAGLVPAIHVFFQIAKDVDARDPPPLAMRASAGLSPPKRLSAKADKRGHDGDGLALDRKLYEHCSWNSGVIQPLSLITSSVLPSSQVATTASS
jgi:hypothetical protein